MFALNNYLKSKLLTLHSKQDRNVGLNNKYNYAK